MDKRLLLVPPLAILVALTAIPARAQAGGSQKPPLYTYVSNWSIPRTQWDDMEKSAQGREATLEKLVADGTIVGYSSFYTLAHEPNGPTHGNAIVSHSLAGIFKALDALRGQTSSGPSAGVLGSGPHGDLVVVSSNYNGHSGKFEDGILRVITLRVKSGEMDAFSRAFATHIQPLYEKLLAEGALHFYSLDADWNVTEPPGTLHIVTIAAGGEGEDRLVKAITDLFASNPSILPGLMATEEPGSRHDYLARVTLMRHK
jgi:hypothetical protein